MKLKKYGRKRERSLFRNMLYTFLILLLYRFLSHVPLPFVDADAIRSLIDMNGSLGLLNTLTGGNLANMSVMALGITPYITASIVLQLMGVLIPKLSEMQKDGSTGRKLYNRITIAFGSILGLLQSVFMLIGYSRNDLLSTDKWYAIAVCSLLMTFGVFLLSFMGDMIQEHFFGNGISLILAVGILCSYLSDGATLFEVLTADKKWTKAVLACVLAVLAIIVLFAFTVWMNYCEKRIKVNYSRKVSKNGGYQTQMSIIPLRLIGGSVVPVIFASSIITLPALVQSFTGTDVKWLHIFDMNHWFSLDEWWANFGLLFYFAMILWFGYYYQSLNLNEVEMAENMQKQGGTITGVRPGKPTADYLRSQMRYLTLLGGFGLCLIASVPIFVSSVLHISSLSFLGTSVIIVVSVIMETWGQYKADNRCVQYKKHKRRLVLFSQKGGQKYAKKDRREAKSGIV